MSEPTWKPTVADMHKAWTDWKAAERPPIWHPIFTREWHSFHLPIYRPATAMRFPKEPSTERTEAYTLLVTLSVRGMAGSKIAGVVGLCEVPMGSMHRRTLETILQGPFQLDGSADYGRTIPVASDTDLWLPDTVPSRPGRLIDDVRADGFPDLPAPEAYRPGPGWRS